ncbi:MAG: hypothetical protein ACRD3C_16825 [Vicinamibacterales bacterium]
MTGFWMYRTLGVVLVLAGCGRTFWYTSTSSARGGSYECVGQELESNGFRLSQAHKTRQWLVAIRDTDRRVPHTTLWDIQDRLTAEVGVDGMLAIAVIEVRRYVTRIGLVEELHPAPADVVAFADRLATRCGR